MSGVGSSGKSGTPPIGHGPNAVVRSPKHQNDLKNKKKNQDKDQQHTTKEGHDEFAVRMDASLYHLNKDDTLEGHVTKILSAQKYIFDSQMGSFCLEAELKLAINEKAIIKVVNSATKIECIVISAADNWLTVPIHGVVTPITRHSTAPTELDAATHSDKTDQPTVYTKPISAPIDMSQEDAAILISVQSIDSRAIPQVSPPKIKDTSPLLQQNLSSIIEANESTMDTRPQTVLKKKAESVHDERPSLSFFYEVYKNKFPDEINELNYLLHGIKGIVPSGLAFFFAGLVFKDVRSWLGDIIYAKMADHVALKSLENDFKDLSEHINCLASEKWRLVVLPHPDGGEDRAIHIISNIQSGQTSDGDSVDMRTLFTQLNFQKAHVTEKPFGQMQIEATMLPNHHGLTLRFGRNLNDDERKDIEQLATLYFTKAGLKSHVLFAPFTSGHTDFQDVVNDLTMMNSTKPLST